MFKRILSVLLIICTFNLIFLPAFAKESKPVKTDIIEAEFQTELNINKASKNQVVQFKSTQDYYLNGFIIPKGTIFDGRIKSFKKGRWAYRRAKARIKIDKLILPSGEIYNIKGGTKRVVLKGSALKNISKGVVTFPVVVAIGAVGVCVIVVEAVSIVGIVLIGPTSYLLGESAGKLSHGVNYKKHPGDIIKLKIYNMQKVPKTVNTDD